MRLASLLLLASLGGAVLAGCSTDPVSTDVRVNHSATLKIEGMTCASCSVTVRAAVRKLDGLASIEVDADAGLATVTYDAERLSAVKIAVKITDAGYPTTVQSDQGV